MNLPPEVIGALASLALVVIGAVGTIVKVLTDRITRELAANTAKTEEAKKAATNAEATSNGRLSEQIKLNQELQQKLYLLQRLIDALETDPDGLKALAIARAKLETLRVMRPGGREERPA